MKRWLTRLRVHRQIAGVLRQNPHLLDLPSVLIHIGPLPRGEAGPPLDLDEIRHDYLDRAPACDAVFFTETQCDEDPER